MILETFLFSLLLCLCLSFINITNYVTPNYTDSIYDFALVEANGKEGFVLSQENGT